MLKRIRTLLAILTFSLITLLLLDFTGTLHTWLGWMAKIQLLPAVLALNAVTILLLAALTLVFGRIYCSVICPLGIMQDVVAHLHSRVKKNRYTYSPEKRILRLSVLALLVIAIAAGIGSLVALLDPYGAYGRIVQNLLQPVYLLLNNLLAKVAERAGSYAFYEKEVWLRSLPTFIVAAVTLAVVAVLAWRGGRTYCNTICPVGTLLGYLSRFSWFKIHFDEEKCVGCSLCTKNCKASCIDYKSHHVDYSRCVACGDCISKCKKNALSYGHPRKAAPSPSAAPSQPQTDTAKRAFLVGSALMATRAAMAQVEEKTVDGGLATIIDKKQPKRATRITPPGSQSLRNMQKHCTACQLCVAQCPNDVLRPSESLLTLMQPEMSYERGFCRPECTTCSEICPAGAILPISKEDKSSTQIGHAVWRKETCIPVADGMMCGNCARHCPTGAIQMVRLQENKEKPYLMIPTVNEEKCIGCGACEYVCPSRPLSAIYVEGHEVHKTV